MGEAAKKDEIKSMDDLVKAVAKKLGKKLDDEKKQPFSTQKVAGDLLEQVDALTDAPKRAFVGAAQKTGSAKKGADAFLDQILEGIPGRDETGRVRSGRLLESTPEYSELVERDARSRGTPEAFAKGGSAVLGSILDVAGGGVGAGEAVAVGKGAAKAAKAGAKAGKEALNVAKDVGAAAKKSTKEFLEASSLLEGGLQTGGIGRLKVESFDNASLEKMKKMTEALKREGGLEGPSFDAAPKAQVASDDVVLKEKTTEDGLGSAGSVDPELSKAQNEEISEIRSALLASGMLDPKAPKKLLEDLPDVKRIREGQKKRLDSSDEADAVMSKIEGRHSPDAEARKPSILDAEVGPVNHQGKSKIPQRMASRMKKNPDGFAEKVLEEGDGEQGASVFLDNIPRYHSNKDGVRYEWKGGNRIERLPNQSILERSEADFAGNEKVLEKLDSDNEKFTGKPSKTGEEPSGVALLDEVEKLGRAESYRQRPDAQKKGYVGKDDVVRSKHQGTSVLDEDDMATRMEGAVQKLQGTQADGATNAQRLRLEELGFDRPDSPHMTEDIANRIIADIEDGKWSPKKGASDKQAAYLNKRGISAAEVDSKEASQMIGGFEELREKSYSKLGNRGKDAPKGAPAGEAPSEAQAKWLGRIGVPEDHLVWKNRSARSDFLAFVSKAYEENKAGRADGMRRKLTELNERLAKAADGDEKSLLKAKRNALEDILGPGPAGSVEDIKRAGQKMDEKVKDKAIDRKEADVSAIEKPAKKAVGSEKKAPAKRKPKLSVESVEAEIAELRKQPNSLERLEAEVKLMRKLKKLQDSKE